MHSKTGQPQFTASSFYKFNVFNYFIFVLISLILLFTPLISNATDISTEIRSYINQIKSVAIEFTQVDSAGRKAEGMLVIDKPYKFRCNYYRPFPVVIVGNKNYVSVYDYEMKNLSRIKAEENVFNFLLLNNNNLRDQLNILSAKEKDGSYILRLTHPNLNKISKIWFQKETKNIQKMQIIEEGNIITLTFGETRKIHKVSSSLFIMQDPDLFGEPSRLSKEALEKKFIILK
jgi:outer membrane lipoprotein-sorting protein